MRGKLGIIVGVGIGYVLGTRAGRERYEQIKEQAVKVWDSKPVQDQVDKVKDLGKQAATALPSQLWDSAVKVVKSTTGASKDTPGKKLDAAVKTAKTQKDDIEDAADESAEAVKDAASKAASKAKTAADKA